MYSVGFVCRSASEIDEVFEQYPYYSPDVDGNRLWSHKRKYYPEENAVVLYRSGDKTWGWDTFTSAAFAHGDLEFVPASEAFEKYPDIDLEEVLTGNAC